MKKILYSAVVAAFIGFESEKVQALKLEGGVQLPPMNHDHHKLAQLDQKVSQTIKSDGQQKVEVKQLTENKIELHVSELTKSDVSQAIESYSQIDPDVYGPNGDNFANKEAEYDFSRIGIDIKQKSGNKKCSPGFYAKAHWIGSLQHDGRIFEDTHYSIKDVVAQPQIFYIGNHQIVNCLELAFQQLSPGDKAHVTCPSFYAYGGAFTQSKMPGGLPLPLHADVEYDVEVVECNLDPSQFVPEVKEEKVTSQALKGDRCFYLHSKMEKSSMDLVLTCQDDEWVKDDHFVHYPGIHCYLEEFVRDEAGQQWYYDENTGYIHDGKYGFYLTNDHGILMLADIDHLHIDDPHFDQWFPRNKQSFEFCPYENILETFINNVHTWVGAVPDAKQWAELEFHPFTDGQSSEEFERGKFHVEYCYQNF